MRVSAVIPTRGDVPMGRILDNLLGYPEIEEVIVVKGSTPFNRYLATERAKNDVVYTQDDDCITDVRRLIESLPNVHAVAGSGLVVNAMTLEHAAQYPSRQTLIGFGAIFNRSTVDLSFMEWERDALFYRESDRIFATINPHVTVFPHIEVLPHAHNPNRLWKQPDHVAARIAMEQRIFEMTGIRA